MPGFPLPLRNALAELTLAAFDDDIAGAALAWLAAPVEKPSPSAGTRLATVHLVEPDGDRLLAVHAGHTAAVAAHAARARRAVHAFDRTRAGAGVDRACRVGAALWNERLFFEVHEVLEVVWRSATGAVREALQGVIQIAVAFHHLAHGNVRGARSLLVEGRRRLAGVAPDTLPVLDVGRLLDDTGRWEDALAAHDVPPDAPPRLGTHVG